MGRHDEGSPRDMSTFTGPSHSLMPQQSRTVPSTVSTAKQSWGYSGDQDGPSLTITGFIVLWERDPYSGSDHLPPPPRVGKAWVGEPREGSA